MLKLLQSCCLTFAALVLSNCSDGALGMRGSPAWYATASKQDIRKYEASGGSRRKATTSYNSRSLDMPVSPSSSRISSSGRTIRNSNGTSCRISSSGRQMRCSDGTSSRISLSGRTIRHSDGSSSRISSSGRSIRHSDGSSSRISSNGRTIRNSDGTRCRISSSGRRMRCN